MTEFDEDGEYIMIPIYEECGSEEAQANGCYQITGYRKEYI